MKGKNAIITGARSGIGLATLESFANNGINVWAVIHREDSNFLSTIKILEEANSVWIKPVYIDLSSPENIINGVKTIAKDKHPIDILVNAAGIVSPNRLFTMTKMEDIRNVMEINFFSVVELSQLISRLMMRQKSGNIINISSVSAWGEDTSQIEYAASKAAITIFTKKLARELGGFGIRVNAVAPGLTETKMTEGISEESKNEILKGMAFKRFGTPHEIAEVCLFLASESSSFITGTTIKVDGGGYDLRLFTNQINNL